MANREQGRPHPIDAEIVPTADGIKIINSLIVLPSASTSRLVTFIKRILAPLNRQTANKDLTAQTSVAR